MEIFLCKYCKIGKVRPLQFCSEQAIITCDNKDCGSLLEESPWECSTTSKVSNSPLFDNQYGRKINCESISSGVDVDRICSTSTTVSEADEEVENLLCNAKTTININKKHKRSLKHITEWMTMVVQNDPLLIPFNEKFISNNYSTGDSSFNTEPRIVPKVDPSAGNQICRNESAEDDFFYLMGQGNMGEISSNNDDNLNVDNTPTGATSIDSNHIFDDNGHVGFGKDFGSSLKESLGMSSSYSGSTNSNSEANDRMLNDNNCFEYKGTNFINDMDIFPSASPHNEYNIQPIVFNIEYDHSNKNSQDGSCSTENKNTSSFDILTNHINVIDNITNSHSITLSDSPTEITSNSVSLINKCKAEELLTVLTIPKSLNDSNKVNTLGFMPIGIGNLDPARELKLTETCNTKLKSNILNNSNIPEEIGCSTKNDVEITKIQSHYFNYNNLKNGDIDSSSKDEVNENNTKISHVSNDVNNYSVADFSSLCNETRVNDIKASVSSENSDKDDSSQDSALNGTFRLKTVIENKLPGILIDCINETQILDIKSDKINMSNTSFQEVMPPIQKNSTNIIIPSSVSQMLCQNTDSLVINYVTEDQTSHSSDFVLPQENMKIINSCEPFENLLLAAKTKEKTSQNNFSISKESQEFTKSSQTNESIANGNIISQCGYSQDYLFTPKLLSCSPIRKLLKDGMKTDPWSVPDISVDELVIEMVAQPTLSVMPKEKVTPRPAQKPIKTLIKSRPCSALNGTTLKFNKSWKNDHQHSKKIKYSNCSRANKLRALVSKVNSYALAKETTTTENKSLSNEISSSYIPQMNLYSLFTPYPEVVEAIDVFHGFEFELACNTENEFRYSVGFLQNNDNIDPSPNQRINGNKRQHGELSRYYGSVLSNIHFDDNFKWNLSCQSNQDSLRLLSSEKFLDSDSVDDFDQLQCSKEFRIPSYGAQISSYYINGEGKYIEASNTTPEMPFKAKYSHYLTNIKMENADSQSKLWEFELPSSTSMLSCGNTDSCNLIKHPEANVSPLKSSHLSNLLNYEEKSFVQSECFDSLKSNLRQMPLRSRHLYSDINRREEDKLPTQLMCSEKSLKFCKSELSSDSKRPNNSTKLIGMGIKEIENNTFEIPEITMNSDGDLNILVHKSESNDHMMPFSTSDANVRTSNQGVFSFVNENSMNTNSMFKLVLQEKKFITNKLIGEDNCNAYSNDTQSDMPSDYRQAIFPLTVSSECDKKMISKNELRTYFDNDTGMLAVSQTPLRSLSSVEPRKAAKKRGASTINGMVAKRVKGCSASESILANDLNISFNQDQNYSNLNIKEDTKSNKDKLYGSCAYTDIISLSENDISHWSSHTIDSTSFVFHHLDENFGNFKKELYNFDGLSGSEYPLDSNLFTGITNYNYDNASQMEDSNSESSSFYLFENLPNETKIDGSLPTCIPSNNRRLSYNGSHPEVQLTPIHLSRLKYYSEHTPCTTDVECSKSETSESHFNSNVHKESPVNEALKLLKDSGWAVIPCNPVINYKIPNGGISPTVVPSPLKNQYGFIGLDTSFWSLTTKDNPIRHS